MFWPQRLLKGAVFFPLFLVGAWSVANAAPEEGSRPIYARSSLVFEKKDGTRVSFDVEIARTREEHAYGLMFQRALGPKEGMVFVVAPPKKVRFWMKNTFIPLDMLFIRSDGTIAKIATAKPLDETEIPSNVPVACVVEVNAGTAEREGLQTDSARLLNGCAG